MLAEAPVFDDRLQAGKELAKQLARYRGARDVIVLAISKEGVEVAFSVAQALRAPLDIVISSLLPIPGQPNTTFGAVTQDTVILNDGLVAQWAIDRNVIQEIARDARDDAKHKMILYRGDRPPLKLASKTVIIVDDGMALGFPLISAIVWARRAKAKRIIVAVPVSPSFEISRLRQLVDEVVSLVSPEAWGLRIATYYRRWEEPTDAAIKSLIDAAKAPGSYKRGNKTA